VQYGAIPVFVDIDPETYNIDVSKLEDAFTPQTRGVVLAHTLGNPFNFDAVMDFCCRHGLFLIEDNADAFGSIYKGRRTGSLGHVSTSSFYPAHHLSTGQGGAVFTDSPLIAKILLSLRNWGKDCVCPPNQDGVCGKRFTQQHGTLPIGYDHKYVFSHLGYNVQGTNLLASLGCSQMKRIDAFTKQRHDNFNQLYDYLFNLGDAPFELPVSELDAVPSWFGFPILLYDDVNRAQVLSKLTAKGVGTRTLFAGNITRQPCFVNNPQAQYRICGNLTQTDRITEQMFWVGSWHGLSSADMEYTGKAIKGAIHAATS
jgi:CDP-6-deoxy-D-xylo-4-hexulose-3-dehydrase